MHRQGQRYVGQTVHKEHGILEVLNKTLLCISKRDFLPGSETYKMH